MCNCEVPTHFGFLFSTRPSCDLFVSLSNLYIFIQVFVDALSNAPISARRSLFTTLSDSLGERSLPIISLLLLLQEISLGDDDGHDGDDDSARTNRVEFVHQIMHGKDSRAQARGWGMTGHTEVLEIYLAMCLSVV